MFKRLRVLFVAVVVLAALLAAAAPALAVQRPTRVMIVVMDQMQPEYAKQYKMSNVLWLQNKGVNFPTAWVGDMASETVVSHNVMVSGLFPKHMGWSDEAFRDVDNILGYGENAIVTSGDLGTSSYVKLIENMDYPKLGDYLQLKFPDKIVANVRPKGLPGRVDGRLQLRLVGADGQQEEDRRPDRPLQPLQRAVDRHVSRGVGQGAALYRQRPALPRQCRQRDPDTYGTDIDAAGVDYPRGRPLRARRDRRPHSGDDWVADAALAIMDNEDWSGLWVTFSAIDKIGHMWGGGAIDTVATYGGIRRPSSAELHMPWAAKNADDQLGRLIAKLKELDQFDDTLIVVTADHGSTYGAAATASTPQRLRQRQRRRLVRGHVVPGLRHSDDANRAPARTPSRRSWPPATWVQLPVDRPSRRGSWTAARRRRRKPRP